MTKNCYSPLKIFHHQEWIHAIRRGDLPKPIFIQLVPTNRCNHNCEFCAYRSEGYSSSEEFDPVDTVPYPKLLEIVQSCREMGVKAIEITGGGEPTCHPQFAELCGDIRDAGIDYAVVTNGSMAASENVRTALLESKWFRISIDAGCCDTYGKERLVRPGTYDRVRRNLRYLCNVKKLSGASDPIIGVGFVVTRRNYLEILRAAKNAKIDGADNIRISAYFQNQGADYFSGLLPSIMSRCAEAKDLEDDTFTVFNMFGQRLQDLMDGHPDYGSCYVQKVVTYIGADLNVYRCCMLAYNPKGLLGSLENQTFKRLWESIRTKELLDELDARTCTRCMFNAKNRVIDYAVDGGPDHVNFI